MNIEIANRLLKYRKKSGFSQEELSEKIGVSRQAVSKWERSEASPDTDNLMLLADIYGVTLDQLLKEDPKDESEEAVKENTEANETVDTDEVPDNEKKVSFKNGIHVNDNGDKVDIGWNGIHVHSKNGDKVDIDKNGINVVEASGEPLVYTDEDGRVHKNNKYNKPEKTKAHKFWERFPYWIIAIAGFFLFGSFNIMGGWATSWMWFLTIPLYYTTVEAIFKRSLNHFCYPVLVLLMFLWAGFFGNMWHPAWLMFLTIPLFYWIASFFSKKDKDHCCNDNCCEDDEDNSDNKKGSLIAVFVGIIFSVVVLCGFVFNLALCSDNSGIVRDTYRIKDGFSDNIYIDNTSSDLTIFHSDKDYSYVDYKAEYKGMCMSTDKTLDVEEENATTKISEPTSIFLLFGSVDSQMNVYLTDKEYDSLVVENTSGKVDISDVKPLKAKSFKLDTTSGDVDVSAVKSESVEIDSTSGDVTVKGAFKDTKIDVTSGSVTVTDLYMPDRLDVDVTSGDVVFNIPEDENGFVLNYDKTSGEIKSDFSLTGGLGSDEGTATYGKGVGKFNVELTSGSVGIYKNTKDSMLALSLLLKE